MVAGMLMRDNYLSYHTLNIRLPFPSQVGCWEGKRVWLVEYWSMCGNYTFW